MLSLLPIITLSITLVAWLVGPAPAPTRQSWPPMMLQLTADSGVVGHYRFTTREKHQLIFDIPSDDPRAELLASATAPKTKNTEFAVTIVSVSDEGAADRRYIMYWLGYRVTGDEVQTLSGLQWDSIFQSVGRQAILSISPGGMPKGVSVTSEAVRPVGQAMAGVLSSLALGLPADSVIEGDTWEAVVSVPVRRPDGTRLMAPIVVTYRLRAFTQEGGKLRARIEFDGQPAPSDGGDEVSGRYFGESAFAVREGHYDRLFAASRLEVKWADSGGLPPSRSLVEWEAELNRSGE